MKRKISHIILAITFITSVMLSCNKKDKLTENADQNAVSFVITQPSIATATFVAKCANYDISIDTIYFLDPNSAVYVQDFGGATFQSNEEFTIGGFTSVDGMWIIQFTGYKIANSEKFDTSVPFNMNIPGDDDEE